MKRYDALVWSLLFVVFALLQYNDPDVFKWMLWYGLASIVGIMVFLHRAHRYLLWAALAAYLLGAILLWPDTFDGLSLKNGYTPSIEEARESLGLAICAVSMVWHLARQKRSKAV